MSPSAGAPPHARLQLVLAGDAPFAYDGTGGPVALRVRAERRRLRVLVSNRGKGSWARRRTAAELVFDLTRADGAAAASGEGSRGGA